VSQYDFAMRTARQRFGQLALLIGLGPNLAWAESYRDDARDSGTSSEDPPPPDEGQPSGDFPQPQPDDLRPPSGDLDDGKGSDAMSRELDLADQADSGRGLEFFWLSGDVGLAYLDLAVSAPGRLLPGLAESGFGPSYGGGIGARLLYFSTGARFRLVNLGSYDVWTLGLELGVRLPLGAFEPYARASGGYLGALRAETLGQQLSVNGFTTRFSGGADYYISDAFSLGAELGLNVGTVSRAPVVGLPAAAPEALGESVSSLALGCELMMNVGFHL
jgi:hypothetical protein